MSQELVGDLHSLIDTSEGIIAEKAEELSEVGVTYTVTECEKFDYEKILDAFWKGENVSEPPIGFSTEEVVKDERSDAEIYEKITSQIISTKPYKKCVDHLTESEELKEIEKFDEDMIESSEQSEPFIILNRFVETMVNECLSEDDLTISSERKSKLITAFIEEVEDSEQKWDNTFWIFGIGSKFESYELESGVKISIPDPDDLSKEVRMDEPWIHNQNISPKLPPTLKITYSTEVTNAQEMNEEEYILRSLLRLYVSGNATMIGYERVPESPLKSKRKFWYGDIKYGSGFSVLESNDGEHIDECFSCLESIFRNKIVSDDPSEDYLSIAFNRYEESIEESSTENKIALSIMCLEALYLKENEKGELAHRLSERVGLILSICDEPIKKVVGKVKSGYNVRSNYVHGSKTEDIDENLLMSIQNIARRSLVMFLQLSGNYEKNEIINKVENALLVKDSRSEIKDEIKESCGYIPLPSH